MSFEGSEKKFELIINKKSFDLRGLGQNFWSKLVALANASILSQISNNECDAYLLSESSLFVWSDRVLMITCGKTNICESIKFLLDELLQDDIELFTFQRKNEHYSHLQNTSFYEDVKYLHKRISGKAILLGNVHEHHNFIFCYDKPYKQAAIDQTLEILLYDIQGQAKEFFNQQNLTKENIREFLQIEQFFPNILIDDIAFKPQGYSLNVISGSHYLTIHITPEENSSYISLETNFLSCYIKGYIDYFINHLCPQTFDIVSFNCQIDINNKNYFQKELISDKLDNGLEVKFECYGKPVIQAKKSTQLAIENFL